MTDDDVQRRLFLVDGTSQVFRAYFALPGLTNADGLPTNAIFGFTSMLRKLLKEQRPQLLAVAFDLPGGTFRDEKYADYKANRPPPPEDLNVQMPYVKQVCDVLGVARIEVEGFEADDLIATYARLGRESGYDVVIVGSDKDLLQLVGEGVRVYHPAKERYLDSAGVEEFFGAPPDRVLDVQGLMGDSVDNIPGVPGIGPKTAVSIVKTYGGLEQVLARAARFVALYDARDALLQAIAACESEKELTPPTAAGLREALESARATLETFLASEAAESERERVAPLAAALGETDTDSIAREGQPGKPPTAEWKALKRELKALDRGSGKRSWYAIHEHADQARLSKDLATLHDRVPITLDEKGLAPRTIDRPAAQAFFRSMGFRTLTEEFARDAQETPPATDEEATAEQGGGAGRGSYDTVLTLERLQREARACRDAGRFALDTETDAVDPLAARLVGISLSAAQGGGCYIPLAHDYLGAPAQLSLDGVREVLEPLFADPAVSKVGQNLKYDAHVLRRHGLDVEGWSLDTMVAAFLLNPGRGSYSMDSLAEEYLGYTPIPYTDLAGTGAKQVTLNQVEVERVTEYAAEDADVTLRLAQVLEPRLVDSGLHELYRDLDGPLLPLLVRMEAHGIRVDTELLGEMSGEMSRAIERSREKIERLAGCEFNPDSPKQLREVLFDRLGLKPRRKTAKSKVASTDAQTLEELAEDHAIARELLEYRELTKLKSTYVDALPRLVNAETGRVHTSYHPTGAATGRLSSSDPNLQNIPARTEAGRRIRSAFVPESGYRFLASDYSQVELRVLAHLTGDPELISAFRAGEDIHRYTAARVFGVDPDLVTDSMRRRAKAVNFGILYGMSEGRLAREQGMQRAEARRFIDTYFERFSSIRGYIEAVREQALHSGAVRTLFGRVRYFPQLQQKVNRAIQEQAYRAAVNTTIQGTAADLMKLAMLAVDRRIREASLGARMLLQVHDELLLEVPQAEIDRTREVVREAMEGVYALAAPLRVDQKVGDSWLEVT